MTLDVLFLFYMVTLTKGHSYKYDVTFQTGTRANAGTEANVTIKLFNERGLNSLVKLPLKTYKRGSFKKLKISIRKDLGAITKVHISHNSLNNNTAWYVKELKICESGTAFFLRSCTFPIEKWFKEGSGTTNALEIEKQETRDCGSTYVTAIHKEVSDRNAWPWQAQIKVLTNIRPHHCSGVLVHRQWVLTAAHCFHEDRKSSSYHITLGDHDLTKKEYTEQEFKVADIIIHPKHEVNHSLYNIALIKLKTPATINHRVKIICLPENDDIFNDNFSTDMTCYSTGWEDRLNNRGPPNILKQTAFIPTNITNCEDIWERTSSSRNVTELSKKFICARHQTEPYCHDDRGGPFVCAGLFNRFKLFGLDILEKQNCKHPSKYTMFVRVAEHLNWIEKNVYARYIDPNTVK